MFYSTRRRTTLQVLFLPFNRAAEGTNLLLAGGPSAVDLLIISPRLKLVKGCVGGTG